MPDNSAPSGLDDALGDHRTTVTSADGLVTAVVDADGRPVELTFDPKAMRRDSAELADTVRRTIAEAHDTARAAAAERMAHAAPPLPDTEQLMGVLGGIQDNATAKLAEMSSVLERLLERPR